VSSEPTCFCDPFAGLGDARLVSLRSSDGGLVLTIETTPSLAACPRCGSVAESKGRSRVELVDLPCFGWPTRTIWVTTGTEPGSGSCGLQGVPPERGRNRPAPVALKLEQSRPCRGSATHQISFQLRGPRRDVSQRLAATTIMNCLVATAAGREESLTSASKENVPDAVGLPEIFPLLAFSMRPLGRRPFTMDQCSAPTPPSACNEVEYEVPFVAFGSAGVTMTTFPTKSLLPAESPCARPRRRGRPGRQGRACPWGGRPRWRHLRHRPIHPSVRGRAQRCRP
jgi:hypothetical protein